MNEGAPGARTGRCPPRPLWIVRVTLIAAFLAVLAGLARTQLGRSEAYGAYERRQNVRRVLESAPRGAILDRDGRVLARDRERIDVVLSLAALRGEFEAARHAARLHSERTGERLVSADRVRMSVVQKHLDRIYGALGREGGAGAADFARHYAHHRLSPYVVATGLTEEERMRIEAFVFPAGVVRLRRTTEREYPQGATAAHVIGRTRRDMRSAPLAAQDVGVVTPNYRETLGDFGVEKQFDDHLRGRPAETILRVDATGLPVEPALEEHVAQPGGDLVLSLDLDLQCIAERAMDEIKGASHGSAVVVDVATGELLVLASKPGFDLNDVSPSMSIATKQRIDAGGGWLNRATQGVYPPGSTFKIFTLLAGLREGTLHPEQREVCEGSLWVGGHRFVCHNPEGHAALPLRTALAQSCNVYAYRSGLAVGASAIAAEARRFHFDAPTGIELPGETQRMLVPDPSKTGSGPNGTWADTDTINLAIGQGSLRISPLQAACAMASLARGEMLTVPTLVRQPGRRPTGGRAVEPLEISGRDYAALLEGLRAVVEVGIGQRAQVPGIGIAGKTGTAQIESPEGMRNVAWFLAFAPFERPEIAIAVALEGDRPGEEFAGAEHAAPVVREIIAAYFGKK